MVRGLPAVAPGATDADLAVVTFTYSAVVPGNVSTEVVKYFLQQYFELDQDLRLDPLDFSLVTAQLTDGRRGLQHLLTLSGAALARLRLCSCSCTSLLLIGFGVVMGYSAGFERCADRRPASRSR